MNKMLPGGFKLVAVDGIGRKDELDEKLVVGATNSRRVSKHQSFPFPSNY